MDLEINNKTELLPVAEYQPLDNEPIMVSVCIGTYNQKKYVGECLDSILSQLVNFKVEILINDDASTDGTQEILLGYQKKYPEVIKLFLAKENQFQKNKQYSTVYRVHANRIKGKYVNLCDSDDYFCDNLALYSKFTALEKHQDCNACFSRVKKINENNNTIMHLMPKKHLTTRKISPSKLVDMFVKEYCFHTSSYFFRSKPYIEFCNHYPLYAQQINVFDEPAVMYFASLGNVYYIDHVFSVYRKFSNNSWSTNKASNDTSKKITNLQKRIDYLNEYNYFTDYKYNKSCKWGINHSQIVIYTLENNINKILEDKDLSKFYRKRHFKDYIRLKYFKH